MEKYVVEISEKYGIRKETAKVLLMLNKEYGNTYNDAKNIIKYFYNIMGKNNVIK